MNNGPTDPVQDDNRPRKATLPNTNHIAPASELVGLIGRITVSVPVGGPGQVTLPVRGTSEAFAAWADAPIPRHTRVVVTDQTSARTVHVKPAQYWSMALR